MKQNLPRRRGLALLLALVLTLTLAPAALAAEACPQGGTHSVSQWETIREATCCQGGVRRGECAKCREMVYEDTARDASNHDARYATYTDNGDGATHSVVCSYDGYRSAREAHTFENGRCTRCAAVNYGDVRLTLPGNQTVYVELGDTGAQLTLDGVRLTLGSADVTAEYTISYNWYQNGSAVGSGASYALPQAVTEREGTYTYACFVMAVPKSGFSGSTHSGSCTVTVEVRDLATAAAAVSADEQYLGFSATNSRTSVSLLEQIYAAVNQRSVERPLYVVFSSLPTSSVGAVNAVAGQPYYFSAAGQQTSSLANLRFTVNTAGATGVYSLSFTAYDERGNAYPGALTITVEQPLGGLDVLYSAAGGSPVALKGEDFSAYWLNTYYSGALTLIRFTALPQTSQGTLYYGYTSAARPGTRVRTGDSFYLSDSSWSRTLIDDVTFAPAANYTGYVSIPFEAYGANNRGAQTYLTGDLCILVTAGQVTDVTYQTTAGGSVRLDGDDFLSVYQAATGSRSTGFYIQLMELPAAGALYLNYTGSGRDTALRERDLANYVFYYSSSRGNEIDDLTYVAGSGSASDSFRYLAYSASGELLYIGQASFRRGDLTVRYTAGLSGAAFRASDFSQLLGTASADGAYVTFTQPTSGALTDSRTGKAVTAEDRFYLGTDLQSVNNVKYTPRSGQNGTVNIAFTIHTGTGTLAGTVQITVRTSYTKSFTDVKTGDWFYTPVMDLAEAGVINGMTPTTYEPNSAVTNGQALKLILLAAGYDEPAQTGRHWASGYLSLASREGLLPTCATITESNLDSNISRYAIAEIAVKALKLPASTLTASPFSDMAMTNASASAVLSLYETGIVEGTTQSDGRVLYYGVNAIRRSEMATIVWRMHRYQTSNA